MLLSPRGSGLVKIWVTLSDPSIEFPGEASYQDSVQTRSSGMVEVALQTSRISCHCSTIKSDSSVSGRKGEARQG